MGEGGKNVCSRSRENMSKQKDRKVLFKRKQEFEEQRDIEASKQYMCARENVGLRGKTKILVNNESFSFLLIHNSSANNALSN